MTFWDFLDQHIATILVTLLGIAGFLVNYLRDIKSSERILDKVNLEWKKEYQEKYLIIPIMEYVDEVINNINSYFTIVAKEELQRFAEAEELKAAANEQNYQLIQKGSIAVVRADALERKYVKSLIENIITFHKNYRIAVGENNIEEIKLNKLLVQERAVHLYKLLQPSIK